MSGVGFFFKPRRWLYVIEDPRLVLRALIGIIRHPSLFITTRNVEGGIGWPVGLLLYETVLTMKCSSSNIVEVGAFKGCSTVYLARAAQAIGKRVKSFELFSGLPTPDSILDHGFREGQALSERGEYETNLRVCGVRHIVDLTVGDARETMLHVIGDVGFCVAFLDVDLYASTRELLFQLWQVAKGGERIIVHDSDRLGVRKAIDEFHTLSQNIVKETSFEGGRAAILDIPLLSAI